MGNISHKALSLTQMEVEELIGYCKGRCTQEEVSKMYTRFRQLDRDHKGYLAPNQIESIPELAINPLAPRLLRKFENVNFRDFCWLLSHFSGRASPEDQVQLIFNIFDADEDGRVSKEDLRQALQLLAGSFLSDEDKEELVERAMKEAEENGLLTAEALTVESFAAVLGHPGLSISL